MAMAEEAKGQRLAWESAQDIHFSVDLIAAAKKELALLALVERNPRLYEDRELLQRAIYRYSNFWLPFVAAKQESLEFVLVPPLDCAWIWHCHRLNPLRYAKDCKQLLGKIVGAPVFDEASVDKTESLWKDHFPGEPYTLDIENPVVHSPLSQGEGTKLSYNLIEAVSRQKTFYYQVSQPHYNDESFLRAAMQRYKGFLHLFKINKASSSTFFVPTYDIDLMWHAHQLSAVAYNRDLLRILGRVLEHDDTDSDRTKGKKLDNGFTKTRGLWRSTYGVPYEKAGCMYRGERAQTLPLVTEWQSTSPIAVLFKRKTMQVRLAVQAARYLPSKNVADTFITISAFENTSEFKSRTTKVETSSHPEWAKLWLFECDSSIGGLVFELRQDQKGILKGMETSKLIGSLTITWKMILETSTLSLDGWFPLLPPEGSEFKEFPSVRLEISVTPPVEGPDVLKIVNAVLQQGHSEHGSVNSSKEVHTLQTRVNAGCGAGCGSGCGSCGSMGKTEVSAGCGAGCGGGCGGCGSMNKPEYVNSAGGCGAGCGGGCGGCGSMNKSENVNSTGCGSGCGGGCGGCGSMNKSENVNSTGCGSGCGGCGSLFNEAEDGAAGCGAGCGGCGSLFKVESAAVSKASSQVVA